MFSQSEASFKKLLPLLRPHIRKLILGGTSMLVYISCWPLLAWLALIIHICVPLSSSLRKFFITKKIEIELSTIGANQQESGASNIKMPGIKQKMQIRYMYVNLKEDRAVLDLVLNVPEGTLTEGKVASINRILFDSIKQFGIRQLDVDTRIVPSRVHQYRETLK